MGKPRPILELSHRHWVCLAHGFPLPLGRHGTSRTSTAWMGKDMQDNTLFTAAILEGCVSLAKSLVASGPQPKPSVSCIAGPVNSTDRLRLHCRASPLKSGCILLHSILDPGRWIPLWSHPSGPAPTRSPSPPLGSTWSRQ